MRTIFEVEREIKKLMKERMDLKFSFKYSFYVRFRIHGEVFPLGDEPGYFDFDPTQTVFIENINTECDDETMVYTDDFIFGLKFITDKKCLIEVDETGTNMCDMIYELFSEHYEKILEYKEKVIDLISTFDENNIKILYEIIKGLKDE
jgi:hypothetical protein